MTISHQKENYTQSVIKYWSEWVMAKSTALPTNIYFALSQAKVQDQIFHAFLHKTVFWCFHNCEDNLIMRWALAWSHVSMVLIIATVGVNQALPTLLGNHLEVKSPRSGWLKDFGRPIIIIILGPQYSSLKTKKKLSTMQVSVCPHAKWELYYGYHHHPLFIQIECSS